MMKTNPILLSRLLESVPDIRISGDTAVPITGITDDSRRVIPGNLFCAQPGTCVDGETYIQEAVNRGAAAIISRKHHEYSIPVVVTSNPRKIMGLLAAAWFDFPTRQLEMIATTGTDGKTSVSYMISRMLSHAGAQCGYIGTLGAFGANTAYDSSHTTPPPLTLHRILRQMADDACHAVSMEASSHGLKQDRLSGIELRSAVFTTFGRDHLDYHQSSDEYFQAKLSIFNYLRGDGIAVINARFPEIVAPARKLSSRMITYIAMPQGAELTVDHIEDHTTSPHAVFRHGANRFEISLKLKGGFQIENIGAASAVGIAMGLEYDQIRRGIESVDYIPGRFEPVYMNEMLRAIIDYAHTPGALKNALKSARELTSNRLVVVFGCGGDRDRGKRPLMGRIAEELADLVIVTSDNPRSEDPGAIIDEIIMGMKSPSDVIRIPDRREAITEAIERSSVNDIVLIAGKGHEKTQTIGDQVHPFDDCAVAREILKVRGNR